MCNSKAHPISLVLEPWGEVFPLAPDELVIALAIGPDSDGPEVEMTEEAITLHCWTGSTIRLFKDGHELGAGLFAPAPVPEGWDKIRKIVPPASR